MKKSILLIVALALLLSAPLAWAGQERRGIPFNDLWEALEEKISLLQFENDVRDDALEARISALEAELEQCSCGETPVLGECNGEEAYAISNNQDSCELSDTDCLDHCADELSTECQTVYQEFRACVVDNCWNLDNDSELLDTCANEECSDLYEAVYGNYVGSECGDGVCQADENEYICAEDCHSETISCGLGACGTSVPYGEECVPFEPTPEDCDAIDNDCDGIVDNNLVDPELECEGTWSCEFASGWVCNN